MFLYLFAKLAQIIHPQKGGFWAFYLHNSIIIRNFAVEKKKGDYSEQKGAVYSEQRGAVYSEQRGAVYSDQSTS